MKKLIIIIITMISFGINLYTQQDKDKLFENLKDQFSKLQSISLDFTLNDNNSVKGHLLSKKGNKYLISFGSRKIFCDGETIWNYMPSNKNVVISKYESQEESASIERVFYELTNNFKPSKLSKIQGSTSESGYFLDLVPKNESKDEITMLRLRINPNNLVIAGITIIRNYNEESWTINSLKINPVIADSKFIFNVPENVEIIDLR